MFSKALEISGLTLVAWGLALLLGTAAGIIFGGIALVFLGAVTDDAAIGNALHRGWTWCRYTYFHQVIREQVTTDANKGSPHPAIVVDPAIDDWARRAARARVERSKVRDRTKALSRPEPEPEPEDDFERLA